MTGAERIAAERQRQIDVEGYTADHDVAHDSADLAHAADCYLQAAIFTHAGWRVQGPGAIYGDPPQLPVARDWPWERAAWKPSDDPIRNLEKAGALIAAEIDRLAALREPVSS